MKIHYALFDSETDNSRDIDDIAQKVYWPWWSDDLADSQPDIYKKCNSLLDKLPKPEDNVWGGILEHRGYTVLYRCFTGTYKTGRDGHHVILTAWIKPEETQGKNLFSIFNDDIFQSVAVADQFYIPKPDNCSCITECDEADGQDSLLEHFWEKEEYIDKDTPLIRSMATWAADKDGWIRSIRIKSSDTSQCVKYDLEPRSKPIQEPEQELQEVQQSSDAVDEEKQAKETKAVQKITRIDVLLAVLILQILTTAMVAAIFFGAQATSKQEQNIPPIRQSVESVVNLPPVPQPTQTNREMSAEEIKKLFRDLTGKQQIEMFDSLDSRAQSEILHRYRERQGDEEQEHPLVLLCQIPLTCYFSMAYAIIFVYFYSVRWLLVFV